MKKEVRNYLETQYERIKQLKASERGEVWLARDKTGGFVVWKSLRTTGLPYGLLKQHPHRLWPQVLYCAENEEAGDTAVIEELINGEVLRSRTDSGRSFSEEQVVAFLLQLCDGLELLHSLGIIHRDIKPDNLMLFKEQIYLLDFDAAREFKPEQETDTRFLGTYGYAAPEQFGFAQTDERSDIFSLGKTMQELLPGDYDGYLKPILAKCTELDPKNRYRKVTELHQALEKSPGWSIWKKLGTVAAALLAITTAAVISDDD